MARSSRVLVSGVIVAGLLLLAGAPVAAEILRFTVFADMSRQLCPGGGVAVLRGSGSFDTVSGAVTGQANIQMSNPVNNLDDCVGFFGPGLIVDGTLFFGFLGNIDDDFPFWACPADGHFDIAQRGPGGGLVIVQAVFRNFGTFRCSDLFRIINLDPNAVVITPA